MRWLWLFCLWLVVGCQMPLALQVNEEVADEESVLLPLLVEREVWGDEWEWYYKTTEQAYVDEASEVGLAREWAVRRWTGRYGGDGFYTVVTHWVWDYEGEVVLAAALDGREGGESVSFVFEGLDEGVVYGCWWQSKPEVEGFYGCEFVWSEEGVVEEVVVLMYGLEGDREVVAGLMGALVRGVRGG
ncbi:MAG TPA: hypothetical protein VLL52_17325 [Anaerolineae bacterium]|nr:hypothetical protein [Anaerolineae bacterium]